MTHCRNALVALGVLLLVFLVACPNPIPRDGGGALTVSINNRINARTLLPTLDMGAAGFSVSGTGPGEATFSQTSAGNSVTITGLAFGDWSVMVNALNAGGTVIGSGQATVTVHRGQTAAVDVSVVPLAGNGSLHLSVSWTASQVEAPPSVRA